MVLHADHEVQQQRYHEDGANDASRRSENHTPARQRYFADGEDQYAQCEGYDLKHETTHKSAPWRERKRRSRPDVAPLTPAPLPRRGGEGLG